MREPPGGRRRRGNRRDRTAGDARVGRAAIYIWNVDASGSWTTPSNWLYAGGGPNGGYPNAAGDQAFFTGEYTAARTVTIPANVTVTVGTSTSVARSRSRLSGPPPSGWLSTTGPPPHRW